MTEFSVYRQQSVRIDQAQKISIKKSFVLKVDIQINNVREGVVVDHRGRYRHHRHLSRLGHCQVHVVVQVGGRQEFRVRPWRPYEKA
jgi:hypothetical protein